MKDFRIADIGVALPTLRMHTTAPAARLGIDPIRLERRIGFRALARKADNAYSADLAIAAFRHLETQGLDLATVDCLGVVTQNPDGRGVPPVSTIVDGKQRLSHRVAAFDIAHGCAAYVYGLAIMKSLMRENDFHRGVLITADPYSKIVDVSDYQTALIFGDAATATLLCEERRW